MQCCSIFTILFLPTPVNANHWYFLSVFHKNESFSWKHSTLWNMHDSNVFNVDLERWEPIPIYNICYTFCTRRKKDKLWKSSNSCLFWKNKQSKDHKKDIYRHYICIFPIYTCCFQSIISYVVDSSKPFAQNWGRDTLFS